MLSIIYVIINCNNIVVFLEKVLIMKKLGKILDKYCKCGIIKSYGV